MSDSEALRWKNAALDLKERLGAVHYGLTSPGPDAAFRVKTCAAVTGRAIEQFERDFPADDSAGWDRTRL